MRLFKKRTEKKKTNKMRHKGYSILSSNPSIKKEEIIWFPGIYRGRTEGEWIKPVSDFLIYKGAIGALVIIEELVALRAKEDGEWAIENGLVGDNEDKMRRMMAFVSDEKNIQQCVEHILKEGMEMERTLDFVCRDLANASKWASSAIKPE